jgi:hypothetical protein
LYHFYAASSEERDYFVKELKHHSVSHKNNMSVNYEETKKPPGRAASVPAVNTIGLNQDFSEFIENDFGVYISKVLDCH